MRQISLIYLSTDTNTRWYCKYSIDSFMSFRTVARTIIATPRLYSCRGILRKSLSIAHGVRPIRQIFVFRITACDTFIHHGRRQISLIYLSTDTNTRWYCKYSIDSFMSFRTVARTIISTPHPCSYRVIFQNNQHCPIIPRSVFGRTMKFALSSRGAVEVYCWFHIVALTF